MSIERTLQSLRSMSAEARDRLRINAEGQLKSGTPQQKANASRVLQAIADQAVSDRQELIDRLGPLPVAQRVAEAFRVQPMTETERKVIQALLDHPGATSEELSRALGWGGTSWHMHFGTMCLNREAQLWPAPPSDRPNRDFYCGILADLSERTHRWSMKPDVAAAFASMGLAPARRASGSRDANL
jgi:hypothetical protein